MTAEDIKTWAYALERFPNVRDFRLLMREARKITHGLLGPTISRTFVEPDIDTDFRYLFPVLPSLSEWTGSPSSAPRPRISLPILHTLHLEGLDPRRLAALTGDRQLKAAGGAPFNFLCEVRDLRVDLASPRNVGSLYPMGALALHSTLAVAKNIVKLRLSWLGAEKQPWLAHIFHEEYTWLHLRNVELHGSVFDAEALAGFIGRHRASLRHFVISNPGSQDDAVGDAAAAVLDGSGISELDPCGILSRAFASASVQRHVEGGCKIVTASWD